MLKKISLIFLVLTLGTLIFVFSNENAKDSNITSDSVMGTIVDVYANATNKEISRERRFKIIDSTRVCIRKFAHFFLYFTLGLLTYLLLKTFNIKHPIVLAIVLSMIYAGTDEFHQLFVDGRTSSILDVLLDTFGSVIGITVCNIPKIIRSIREKNNNCRTV